MAIAADSIAQDALVKLGRTYSPRPQKAGGAASTRHNTYRSFNAVKAFLASGPQPRKDVNQMLTDAYGHGCYTAWLIQQGILVEAEAGAEQGKEPVWPEDGRNNYQQKAEAAEQEVAELKAKLAALEAPKPKPAPRKRKPAAKPAASK